MMMRALFLCVLALSCFAAEQDKFNSKPAPADVMNRLKAGNDRFVAGKSIHPHGDALRRILAAEKNQGDYAVASILSCSDSRVPVELIFDSGIMDLFVIRVPGNICQNDEIGSVEYGVHHVFTPLVVVLGHSDCGAVTAAASAENRKSHHHRLERSIPELLKPIRPVVKRVKKANPALEGKALVEYCIRENVYQEIENLLERSAATRLAFKAGKIMVTGAVYDIRSGKVEWLDAERIRRIAVTVEQNKTHETIAYAE